MNRLPGLLYSLGHNRARQAAKRSQYWVRWAYTEGEWKRFDRLDWGRTRRWWCGTLVVLAMAPCFWACIGLAALQQFLRGQAPPSNRPSWFPYAWYISAALVVLATLTVAALFIQGEWRTYIAGRARHEERQAPESNRIIAIGPLGIYQSGFCVPLVGPNLRLSNVYVDPSDPSLLKFQMFYGRNIPTGISIPISNGQEASARQLVERFREEVL